MAKVKATIKPATGKINVVFIRKSGKAQDERSQRINVHEMLRRDGIESPPSEYWFCCTIKRKRVREDPEFNRLLELVESDRVGTVYIETQDRWGTTGRVDLFTLMGILRTHETLLYDLRAKKDISADDFVTELMVIMQSFKSEKELQDLSYRSLRTRVNNFKASGSWPTGTQPFGFGKACHSIDGKLLWEWHPVSRFVGQVFFANGSHKLKPGAAGIKIPRKNRLDTIKLVPSRNKEHVKTVRLVFDLFVKASLSRRKISAKMNSLGRKFYDAEFTHSLVTQILTNPAYVGMTHFGKTQAGDLHSFDDEGLIVEVKGRNGKSKRDAPIKKATHKGLIDRDTWRLAQARLKDEGERTSFAPRKPEYYLKPIFVCGHCGKNLSGRTENDPSTGERRVAYFCSTYIAGKSAGRNVSCGAYRITHVEAEKLLFDKMKELDVQYDTLRAETARTSIEERLEQMGKLDEDSMKQWLDTLNQGVDAFVSYVKESIDVDAAEVKRLRFLAKEFYWDTKMRKSDFAKVPLSLAKFKKAIMDAETEVVHQAQKKVASLSKEHEKLTKAWASAEASDRMKTTLKQELDRVDAEIAQWEGRTTPLSARLKTLFDAECNRQAERTKLAEEWPALENAEKGEALRRLFKTVILFWSAEFHEAEKNPSRERRTKRKGRNSYTLEKDRIQWSFADANLAGSS